MSILNKFGPRHVQLAAGWVGTAARFGGAAGLAVLYFTDWKVVLKYLPYYNGKFPKEE